MGLVITKKPTEQGVCLSVAGEVDVSNAGELRDELDRALAEGARNVVLDMTAMPYIDSTGIGVLVGFAHRCAEAQASFAVANPQRNVARVLALLGLSDELGIAD